MELRWEAGPLQGQELAEVGRLGGADQALQLVDPDRKRRVGEVRPALGRAVTGLLVAPGSDGGVVARQQDGRDVEPAPGRGLGEDGVLEQALDV